MVDDTGSEEIIIGSSLGYMELIEADRLKKHPGKLMFSERILPFVVNVTDNVVFDDVSPDKSFVIDLPHQFVVFNKVSPDKNLSSDLSGVADLIIEDRPRNP